MHRSMIFAVFCLLLVSDSFQLNAQRRPGTGLLGRTRVGAPAVRGRWYRAGAGYGLGIGPYGYGGGAVNAAGDAARGFSEVIRARGEAEESASRARINNAEARAK